MNKRSFIKRILTIIPAVIVGKNIPPDIAEPIKKQVKDKNKECGIHHGGIKEIYFIELQDIETFYNK